MCIGFDHCETFYKQNNFTMRRSLTKSHWGEFPDIIDEKYEIDDVFSIYPPEKRFKIEILGGIEEDPVLKRYGIQFI